jgi:hypothetical protein
MSASTLCECWPHVVAMRKDLTATIASKRECKRNIEKHLAEIAEAAAEHDKSTAIVLREIKNELALLRAQLKKEK